MSIFTILKETNITNIKNKRAMKAIDLRINDLLSAKEYIEIADEYLGELGRKSNGGYMMSGTEFRAVSYPWDRNEKKLEVTINYREQSIEII